MIAPDADLPRSPCNKVCQIDIATGWCLGCGRTLAEIAAWPGLTPAERRALLAALPARLPAILPRPRRRW
jgi:predicted Fe-S protein YdhL (DUF1289 family)